MGKGRAKSCIQANLFDSVRWGFKTLFVSGIDHWSHSRATPTTAEKDSKGKTRRPPIDTDLRAPTYEV